MKLSFTFFFFLCFQLLSGHDTVQASSYFHKLCAFDLSSIQQAEGVNSSAGFHLSKTTDVDQSDTFVISVDDEDEEEDIVKRHVLPADCFFVFNYSLISIRAHCSPADNLFYSTPAVYSGSPRYISFRVLRI